MFARAPTQTDRIIGKRVRLARKRMKFSQTTLGNAVGVTYQQIQKYENGSDRIGAARLYQVARATGQPITFFFDDDTSHGDTSDVNDALVTDPKVEKLLVAVAKVENERLIDDLVRIAETFAGTRETEQAADRKAVGAKHA
ncbi:MAG: helix-turn-helix domain-containing protein [Salinarimonas sp.]|nr:helix-turn-helix domain-containing protein [Salinarimonas sp.]